MHPGCALCATDLTSAPCREEGRVFCCHGCMAVYRVLLVRGELADYRDSRLFKHAVASGLISNPALLQTLQRNAASQAPVQKVHFMICDLWCPSCADVIGWIMLQHIGVTSCHVDYSTDCASITYDPMQVSTETLFSKICAIGYQVEPISDTQEVRIPTSLRLRSGIAAFCALHLMMLSSPLYVSFWTAEEMGYTVLFEWLSAAFALPIVTYCLYPLYKKAWGALKVGVIGMEALVVISVLAAFFYSVWQLFMGTNSLYFDSMAVIVSLVLAGKILELRAKFSARQAFFQLMRALPVRGRRRFDDGTQGFVPLKDIPKGALMVAHSGEKIVLDGEVIEGEAAVDESLLNGETVPVVKHVSSFVMAGSIVRQGSICYRVTSESSKTLLQQMVQMAEHDVGKKEHAERLADRISAWFIPCIIATAGLTGAYLFMQGATHAEILLRMLAILLIACPCAIGVADPLVQSYVLRAMTNQGIIVRNRNALRKLAQPTVLVCDKTGTLTCGKFTLLTGLQNLSLLERQLLKGMTLRSIHPISTALAEAIQDAPIDLVSTQEVMSKGLRANYEECLLLLGSKAWMLEHGLELPIEPVVKEEELALTTVYFCGLKGHVHALILGDQLREGAAQLRRAISPCRMVILSGDQEKAVAHAAKKCGCSEWKAGCLPLDKRQFIEELRSKGETVCMLGDGVNDALALSLAHAGISVASATEVSTHVSDVLLTREGLESVAFLFDLAKKGERITRQNLFWAFFYNVIGIELAVVGLLSPLFAAFAMMLSSLIVLLNAKRAS